MYKIFSAQKSDLKEITRIYNASIAEKNATADWRRLVFANARRGLKRTKRLVVRFTRFKNLTTVKF